MIFRELAGQCDIGMVRPVENHGCWSQQLPSPATDDGAKTMIYLGL